MLNYKEIKKSLGKGLDKVVGFAILKAVKPTALLRFGERWQSFYL